MTHEHWGWVGGSTSRLGWMWPIDLVLCQSPSSLCVCGLPCPVRIGSTKRKKKRKGARCMCVARGHLSPLG